MSWKKFFYSFVFLLSLFFISQGRALTVRERKIPALKGDKIPVTFYLPENAEGALPLILGELPEGVASFLAGEGIAVVEIHAIPQRLRSGYSPDEELKFFFDKIVEAAKEEIKINEAKIGVIGGSAGGIVAFRLGAFKKLAACVPIAAPHHAEEVVFQNNTVRFTNGLALLVIAGTISASQPDYIRERAQKLLQDLGISTLMGKKKPSLKGLFHDFSPSYYLQEITCPLLIINSWQDMLMGFDHAWENYQLSRGPKKLLMSEGAHGSEVREEELAFQFAKTYLFLEHYLKGIENGIEKEPPFVFSLPGSQHPFRKNEMEHFYFSSFPPEFIHHELFYLHQGRVMNKEAPQKDEEDFLIENGMQESLLEDDAVQALFRLLPNLFSQVAGEGNRELTQFLPLLQGFFYEVTGLIRPVALGTIYDTPPFAENVLLLGAPQVQLTVTPHASFLQFHLKLYDVDEKGRGKLVTRVPYTLDQVPPQKPVTLTVFLRSAFYRLKKGHRLRLAVTSTDFPAALPLFQDFSFTLHHGLEKPYLSLSYLQDNFSFPPPPSQLRLEKKNKKVYLVWTKPQEKVQGFFVYQKSEPISLGSQEQKKESHQELLDILPLDRIKLAFANGYRQIGYVPFPENAFLLESPLPLENYALSSLSLSGIEGKAVALSRE